MDKRDYAKIALIALALGGPALPSLAVAQTIEAADAAEPIPHTGKGANAPKARQEKKTAYRVRPRGAPIESIVDADEPTSLARAQVINWVIGSGDNRDMPFLIIDKVGAQVLVYDADGEFVGATPALLGSAHGDDSVPGVGDRELSDIAPEDRTTPAGRFVASYGPASGNRTVLWVDYATSISLHPVVTANAKERRLQRLRSPSPKDNRITYGCINVSPAFYKEIVRKHFARAGGVVYVLPETKSLKEAFPTLGVHSQITSRADE